MDFYPSTRSFARRQYHSYSGRIQWSSPTHNGPLGSSIIAWIANKNDCGLKMSSSSSANQTCRPIRSFTWRQCHSYSRRIQWSSPMHNGLLVSSKIALVAQKKRLWLRNVELTTRKRESRWVRRRIRERSMLDYLPQTIDWVSPPRRQYWAHGAPEYTPSRIPCISTNFEREYKTTENAWTLWKLYESRYPT